MRARTLYLQALEETLTAYKLATSVPITNQHGECGGARQRARDGWSATVARLAAAHEAYEKAGGKPNPVVVARWRARVV